MERRLACKTRSSIARTAANQRRFRLRSRAQREPGSGGGRLGRAGKAGGVTRRGGRLDGPLLGFELGLVLGRGALGGDGTEGDAGLGRGIDGSGLLGGEDALAPSCTVSLPMGFGGGRCLTEGEGWVRRASGKLTSGTGKAGRAITNPCAKCTP